MGQVVTELVIDSNTAGADQFSQSMDKANTSAKNASSSAASMTLAIAGVGVSVVAALVGLRSFVDYVGTTNKQFADITQNAANAGMSTREFQATLFAARSAGLTEKDFVSGLDKIGTDLTAASRGVTDFGKLFEANGISIKQTNGEIKTAGQALADIMGLMQKSTPDVQRAIAGIVGVSKEWIPFLREGSDEFDKQKQAAAGLGVIIDGDVISKAKEFDTQWHTAVATWDLQFRAVIGSILPMLVQLATMASTILDKVGQFGSFVSRSLTPIDQQSASDMQKNLDGLVAYRAQLANVNAETSQYQKFRLDIKGGALGLDSSDLATVDAAITKVQGLIQKKTELVRIDVTRGDGAILPKTGGAAGDGDPVDKAINTLRKHIEQQNADTQSVDLGAAAHARFRAQAAETSAVLANGGKETAEQAKQFDALKTAAAAAAEALARAKIASDIKFGANTALLSQADVQIASQLRTLYPNVTDGLNSAYAAQLRFNAATKEITGSIENGLVTGLTDIGMRTKTVGQGFSDMGLVVIRAIEQMIVKILVVQPLMAALQASVSSSGILSFLGGGSVAGGAAASSGAAGIAGLGGLYHTGGIVGSEPTMMRYVHPAYFDSAPRMHSGGIAADETPAILQKGEGVFTKGQMAAMGGGSGASAVHVSVGVTVDDAGKLQAYVKSVSRSAAADGVAGFVSSPEFVGHVASATVKAKTRRLIP